MDLTFPFLIILRSASLLPFCRCFPGDVVVAGDSNGLTQRLETFRTFFNRRSLPPAIVPGHRCVRQRGYGVMPPSGDIEGIISEEEEYWIFGYGSLIWKCVPDLPR